jgi:hypothetical protein
MAFWSQPRSSHWYISVPPLHSPCVQRQPTISSEWSHSGKCADWVILAATMQSYTPNLNQGNWIREYAWFSTKQSITYSLSVIKKTFNSLPFTSVLSIRRRCNEHIKFIHVRDLRFSCQRCWMLNYSGELGLADWQTVVFQRSEYICLQGTRKMSWTFWS